MFLSLSLSLYIYIYIYAYMYLYGCCWSIRFKAKDMEWFECLIKNNDIRYFSYKMRNDRFLLQAMKTKLKDCTAKV